MSANKEKTGAHTDDAAVLIVDDRERIDALDERIIALVLERMVVSARIQHARIASGGRRVNLSRETGILRRYRESLGRPGTAFSMALLELCRGTVKSPQPAGQPDAGAESPQEAVPDSEQEQQEHAAVR